MSNINQPLFVGNDPCSKEELRDNAAGFGNALWVNAAWNLEQGAEFTVEALGDHDDQDTQLCVVQ